MIFINPLFMIGFSFFGAFFLFSLQWSNLYNPLHAETILFLFSFLFIFSFYGYFIHKKIRFLNFLQLKEGDVKNTSIIVFCVSIVLIFDWILGGVKFLNVFLISFSGFYSVHLFYLFLSCRLRKYLYLSLFLLLLNSIFNSYRILIVFTIFNFILLLCCFFNPLQNLKRVLITFFCFIIFCFSFGALGNHLKGEDYNSGDLIKKIGEANENFENSIFSYDELFWFYLYASSPLANFDLNVKNNNSHLDGFSTEEWLIREFTFDSISKIVFSDREKIEGYQVNSALNVSTVFLRSYMHLGWFGVFFHALFILIFPFFYYFLIRRSKYFFAGMSLLSALYALMIFDNMWAFTPLSFQIVYPVFMQMRLHK